MLSIPLLLLNLNDRDKHDDATSSSENIGNCQNVSYYKLRKYLTISAMYDF